ncbi:udp-transferase [Niveomyces insectorum RCEF 264]|uniref:Udp-transferase n=1 Tax=Niveomyces insectorum RCEF 264 TaxID=1081102 RepID=A0A167UYX0_9HYPO|nr:udp-transferase [Niveomyces insectorum RCEF 264]
MAEDDERVAPVVRDDDDATERLERGQDETAEQRRHQEHEGTTAAWPRLDPADEAGDAGGSGGSGGSESTESTESLGIASSGNSHLARTQSNALLRFDSVTREGRSASVVRDSEGRIVYPTLVPPEIESLSLHGPTHGAGHDAALDAFPTRSRTVSAPPNPDVLAAPGGGDGGDGGDGSGGGMMMAGTATATSSTAAVSSSEAAAAAAGATTGAEPKTRFSSESEDWLTSLGHSRKRSDTLPLPYKRRYSNASIIHELRKTSTLLWNMHDHEEEEDEAAVACAFHAVDNSPGVALHRSQDTWQPEPPSRKTQRGSFWRKAKPTADIETAPQKAHHPPFGSLFHHHHSIMNSRSFKRDGRLPISVKDTHHTGYLAKAVGLAVQHMRHYDGGSGGSGGDGDESASTDVDAAAAAAPAAAPQPKERKELSAAAAEFRRISRNLMHQPCPRLKIVIMVIGSRGDVQPFLKIGKLLKEKYGHRVRVATHPAFREFIEKEAGLEFFSVGGDPAELMAFMVKNPGMIPSLATVKSGDIGRRRASMAEMFEGFWRACVDATDDPHDIRSLKLVGDKEPFIADAIIANPPSFAHVHCAEALGIPLHLMFTFPYTPTQAFPHPLASIKRSNVDPGYTNFISYPLIDMMVWQGLGDLVNNFRVQTLDLDPISKIWAPEAVYRMHVPFTYLWSPGLVPKPDDWGPEVDLAGFVFLELAASFTPPSGLATFLAASAEPPIYIGFGSIVVDDADRFTAMIFDAVRRAGVRALVSKGWGGFGGDGTAVPDNVYLLENTPHDWLFPQMRACVIHGGAGTTAMALKCGLPTMVVPFFGDQYFWGAMIDKAKVGPPPVPYRNLTAERLADGIRYCLGDEARAAAQTIATSIEKEGDGADNACLSFLRTLRFEGQFSMRCAVFPDRVAVWQRKDSNVRLSALAADALVERGYVSYKNLHLIRHTEWNDFEGPGEPITAVFGSLLHTFRNVAAGPFTVASRLFRSRKAKGKKGGSDTSEPHEKSATGGGRSRGGGTRKADDGSFEVAFATVGESVSKSAVALAMAPIDLYFALCQGFHNAPRLYGDDTVRPAPRVTGIKSGLRAARDEFVFGVYDGVTGLVRLPLRAAREHGGLDGFARGVGMGLMGFVLKDIAAPTRYLRRARMAQGQREMRALDTAARQRCLDRAAAAWETMGTLYKTVVQGDKASRKRRNKTQRGGGEEKTKSSNKPATGKAAKATNTTRSNVVPQPHLHHLHPHHPHYGRHHNHFHYHDPNHRRNPSHNYYYHHGGLGLHMDGVALGAALGAALEKGRVPRRPIMASDPMFQRTCQGKPELPPTPVDGSTPTGGKGGLAKPQQRPVPTRDTEPVAGDAADVAPKTNFVGDTVLGGSSSRVAP